jgi:DNA end-binding protein Ku
MRSIWKGAISFGLVTIPVKLYSATEQKDVSFHQVRRSDGSRIKYKRVAAVDGEEVSYGEIAKGYELSSGETVVLTDEDFKDLPLTTNRAIDVLQFVPLEELDPIFFEKSYYLEPDKAGVKPYVLLRDALEQSGKVAVVKVALRNRESLAALRVRDGVFVLETMLWPDEVRTPEFGFLDEDVEVRPQELAMAGSLIETLTGEFDASQYKDEYREALQAVIEAKVEGREVVQATESQPTTGTVVDLMAALRASVEAAKKGSAASSPPAEEPEEAADEQVAAPAKRPPRARHRRRRRPRRPRPRRRRPGRLPRRPTSRTRRRTSRSGRASPRDPSPRPHGRLRASLDAVSGLVCLQGGAEFGPACREMDAELLRRAGGPVVVTALAGAVGREYRTANEHGVRHFRALGAAEVVAAPDAREDPAGALEVLRRARLLVLPGGSPARLLEALRSTGIDRVVADLLADGGVVSGSSAGAMVLCGWTVLPDRPGPAVERGLGIAPDLLVLPHWSGRGATTGCGPSRRPSPRLSRCSACPSSRACSWKAGP